MTEQTESKPSSQPARRVIVAEDETLIRLDIIEILRGEGYEVVGEAAVSYTHLTLPTICSV